MNEGPEMKKRENFRVPPPRNRPIKINANLRLLLSGLGRIREGAREDRGALCRFRSFKGGGPVR